jgi:ATP-dependent DNA helicase RecG
MPDRVLDPLFPDEVIIYHDGSLPEHRTVSDLLVRHRSKSHNPTVANVFFRSGMVETWGRGIEKTETACREAGMPAPVFAASAADVQVSFPIAEVGTVKGTDGTVNGTVSLTDLERSILRAMTRNSGVTYDELSGLLAVPRRTVSREIKRLREVSALRRIGSDKSGRWDVVPTDVGEAEE